MGNIDVICKNLQNQDVQTKVTAMHVVYPSTERERDLKYIDVQNVQIMSYALDVKKIQQHRQHNHMFSKIGLVEYLDDFKK